ncbi:MAG: hypothetical protein Q8N90_03920 [bacterium]|nr:hypothetical protein [bacterium]
MKKSVQGRRPVNQPRMCGNCLSFPKGKKMGECSNPRGRKGPQKTGDGCCNHHYYRINGF